MDLALKISRDKAATERLAALSTAKTATVGGGVSPAKFDEIVEIVMRPPSSPSLGDPHNFSK